MLFLHETHDVLADEAGAFEAAYRDEWMPRMADGDEVRLLWFLHQATPGGPPGNVVTISVVRDGGAWERLVDSLRDGPLERWRRHVDACRRDVTTRLLLPLHWSPLVDVDLGSVPVDDREHEPALYLEDTMWPHDGKLLDYIDAAGSVYVERAGAGLLEPDHDPEWRKGAAAREPGVVKIEAAFQPAFGSHRRKEVILWQPIFSTEMVGWWLANELPEEEWQEGSWMSHALALRDLYQSRLLRTAPWSPWY